MTETRFDYSKLRGRIKERYGTEKRFADEMGISSVSLGAKLNNRVGFKNSEIRKACMLLEIDLKDASEYFLCNLS
ncbi:MAG: DUF739 family protein [Eubacteriales bacterium]|nr:DUF739 family protein [Eubacteriales bacterium]